MAQYFKFKMGNLDLAFFGEIEGLDSDNVQVTAIPRDDDGETYDLSKKRSDPDLVILRGQIKGKTSMDRVLQNLDSLKEKAFSRDPDDAAAYDQAEIILYSDSKYSNEIKRCVADRAQLLSYGIGNLNRTSNDPAQLTARVKPAAQWKWQ